MGCASAKHASTKTSPNADESDDSDDVAPVMSRSRSAHGELLACERAGGLVTPQPSTEPGFIQSQLASALKLDWAKFDWTRDCHPIHEGSRKVVGRLKSHPSLALASVKFGDGVSSIDREISTLCTLQENGIRTLIFSTQQVDVPHIDKSINTTCKGYLFQYFSEESVFLYEEGEPGTPDYFLEPMLKLRILHNDEGIWAMNRYTIRVLKENDLGRAFMEDLSAYVKFMLAKGVRIVDFQGLLGKNGHFYVADPLYVGPIEEKVNRKLLEGVFMSSTNPKRENTPNKAAFAEGLGMELGVSVPDEEEI